MSDQLGIPEEDRPACRLIGADGNIFNLIGMVSRSLKDVGQHDKAREMRERVKLSGSYEDALCILCEYVNPW